MSNRSAGRYDVEIKRESHVAPSSDYRLASSFEATMAHNTYSEDPVFRPRVYDHKQLEGGRWVNVPQLYNRLVSTRSEVSVYDDATHMQCTVESDFDVFKHTATCIKVRK